MASKSMSALAFIGLNVLDAYLTKVALTLGARELNPLAVLFGSDLLLKGLLAAAIVLGLYFWGKMRLLLPLCFGMFGVCLWNLALCLIGGGLIGHGMGNIVSAVGIVAFGLGFAYALLLPLMLCLIYR